MNRVSCNRLHPVLFNEKVVICKKENYSFQLKEIGKNIACYQVFPFFRISLILISFPCIFYKHYFFSLFLLKIICFYATQICRTVTILRTIHIILNFFLLILFYMNHFVMYNCFPIPFFEDYMYLNEFRAHILCKQLWVPWFRLPFQINSL